MQIENVSAVPAKANFIERLEFKLAAIDEEILRRCPKIDWDNSKAIGEIMICVWVYQTGLFFNLGWRLWGFERVGFELAGAMFLATFITLVDSYMVNRGAPFIAGLKELKKVGVDLGNRTAEQVKSGVIFTVRILLLSIPLAQLSGLFFSLLVFGSDINARIDADNLRKNASLTATITKMVDDRIRIATDAEAAQAGRVADLSKQVTSLRNGQIDPLASDVQIQQAQQEVASLVAEVAKASEAQRANEDYASDEFGGVTGQGRSGHAGDGPRHEAAVEKAANAKRHTEEITRALDAARARLEALRQQLSSTSDAKKQQANAQLPHFEEQLAAETAELTKAKEELTKLTDGREEAIRKAVETAPEYVKVDFGLLAQITVLENIVEEDHRKGWLILVIDLCSFGLELAAVLLKVTCYVPTTYCAIVLLEHTKRITALADQLMEVWNKDESKKPAEAELFPPEAPAEDRLHDTGVDSGLDPFENAGDPAAQPPKRRRGRPRKSPADTNGSKPPSGKNGKRGNQARQGQYKVGDLPGNVAIFK